MIGFFPSPYNDEVAYSLFSRYYMRSGYHSLVSATEDLFLSSKCHPNMELCNPLSNDAKHQIGDFKRFFYNHTMFNYYRAFLTPQKQLTVWEMVTSMDYKTLMSTLPIPKSKYTRYLRYCPACVFEDRREYGETFWHRAHQLYGVSVCHKHRCKLIDSSILITSNSSPTLITAEESIGNSNGKLVFGSNMEYNVAKYIYDVLRSWELSNMSMATYLRHQLRSTPYVSPRGASRDMKALSSDFRSFYNDIDLLGFGESWQIEKILNDKRFNPFENCLLGLFLGIKPTDLVKRKVDNICNDIEEFDAKVKEMKAKGITYRQISQRLNISYDYCKLIANGKVKKKVEYSSHQKGRRNRIDWQSLDMQMLPRVKSLINHITSVETTRPQKVSYGRIERLLHLKERQILKLPRCVEYIKKKLISQEEHYALVIAWAVKQLQKCGKPIHVTNIQRVSNLRKSYIIESFPYLHKHLDKKTISMIEECISKTQEGC